MYLMPDNQTACSLGGEHCQTSDINCKELGNKQKANPQKHNVRLYMCHFGGAQKMKHKIMKNRFRRFKRKM